MPDKNLIRKYLDGQANPEESAQVIAYLAADDSDWGPLQECFREAPMESIQMDVSDGHSLREDVLSSLRQQLYPDIRGRSQARDKPGILFYQKSRYLVAAAASVVIVISSLLLHKYQRSSRNIPEIASEWKTIRNKDVRTRLGVLPDGTQCYLSPNSTLYYAADFGSQRIVKLEGEAFFDVKRDEHHPFEVRTGKIITQVLGTAFNIEAYEKELTVRISLVQGKVAIRENTVGSSVDSLLKVLNPGEMLTYFKDTRNISASQLKVRDVHEWENGFMFFNELPVSDALARIARCYGLTLELRDAGALQHKHITGTFKQQPLNQMLDIILFISQYKYHIKGDTLKVFPK